MLLQLVEILNTLFTILTGQLTFVTETFKLLCNVDSLLVNIHCATACSLEQGAQLSPRDRAMHRVS